MIHRSVVVIPLLKEEIVELKPLPDMSPEEIEAEFNKHVSSGESLRKFIQDVDSRKIIHFSWDSNIPFDEFRRRVLSGYYDKK